MKAIKNVSRLYSHFLPSVISKSLFTFLTHFYSPENVLLTAFIMSLKTCRRQYEQVFEMKF